MKIKNHIVANLNFSYHFLNSNDKFKLLRVSNEKLDDLSNLKFNGLNFSSKFHNIFDSKVIELSSRELECAKLIFLGNSNTEIAKKLSILNSTVSYYKKRILHKTKTKNIVELNRLFNEELSILKK